MAIEKCLSILETILLRERRNRQSYPGDILLTVARDERSFPYGTRGIMILAILRTRRCSALIVGKMGLPNGYPDMPISPSEGDRGSVLVALLP
jgi:hypothetical protein